MKRSEAKGRREKHRAITSQFAVTRREDVGFGAMVDITFAGWLSAWMPIAAARKLASELADATRDEH